MTDPHPPSCRMCRGSGYADGPTIIENTQGHTTTSVKPCTHPWWNDDPDLYDRRWIAPTDPAAQAAVARGLAQGLADIDALRKETRWDSTRPTTAGTAGTEPSSDSAKR